MDQDLETVVANERRLLEPETRCDDAAVRAHLHSDFGEFGASGTVWDRQSIVQATSTTAEYIDAEDFRPVRLGPDAILLTYTARRRNEASLRTSVWVREGDAWLLLHHQGTPVPDSRVR
ncbi:hypothetical protein DFQ14_12138 [Halopolyspora algeriensis]|uniref:DUF4440 domain-containing protein n=1 Tax=Halopolyspora algeriensis TaxID=1500506 RepID=A0A368VE75_9ACTN|nr:DUF4440 domain-containing protein [Halopolyspora algeriensis]RCW38535.1 hypothetical protein DFQ14_12138 [Halopolyspora algeriensis]TQM42616.1 hypothetical protein FHU43_4253 [Halopolyspora algeriensis]